MMTDTDTFKILMLGDVGVGKTCLLQRFVNNRYTGHYKCTLGVDCKVRYLDISGNRVKLHIWDTAGEERYRSMMSSSYRHVQGIILVFDTTRRCTYMHIDYWLSEIKKHAPADICIVLVGSKCDAVEKRQVCQESIFRYADYLGIPYFEASAASGVNVERLFYKLAVSIFELHETSNNKEQQQHQHQHHQIQDGFYLNPKDIVAVKQRSNRRKFCC